MYYQNVKKKEKTRKEKKKNEGKEKKKNEGKRKRGWVTRRKHSTCFRFFFPIYRK